MSYITNKDFLLEVAKGNVAGHSLVRKFGINPDIDNAATYEDIWYPGGSKTWLTSAQSLEIVSDSANDTNSSGTGARTVKVYTLTASLDLSQETVFLAGTAAVALSGTHYDCHAAHVITSGSSETNEGTIDVQVASGGSILAEIHPAYGETAQALYMIPNGYTGYLLDWGVGVVAKGTAATIEGQLVTKEPSESWRVRDVREAGIFRRLDAPMAIPEHTIVRVRATSDADNAAVRGTFSLLLVAD